MRRPHRRPLRGRASRGQVLVILALTFTVLVGIAGLAIDAGHNYMVRRSAQNAADGGALAAGQQLLAAGGALQKAPSSGDTSIKAAHDFAANNGFTTSYDTTCDTGGTTSFTTTWFDSGSGLAGQLSKCHSTAGFTDKVTVNVPPCGLGPTPTFPFTAANCTGIDTNQGMPNDCLNRPYNCFQLVITHRTQNYFLGVFGFGSTYTTTMTVVYASPPGAITPPPYAVYLYQPQTGCNAATQQCFTEGTAPSRTTLSCSGANCPTFWTQHGTKPMFTGINGNNVTGTAGDLYPAVQSNGDMVLDDSTTFCDPYTTSSTPVTCTNGQVTGSKGFSLNGTKLYCKQFGPAATSTGPVACANTALGTDNNTTASQVFGNETAFAASSFTTSMTNPTNHCHGLILNGEQVTASSFHGGTPDAGCVPAAGDEYTIEPGVYDYIVVNHGQYTVDSGIFEITGTAPVDTVTSGTADGIDHANERTTTDFDLCNAGQPNSCPTLTAGVWIGHGKLAHAAFNTGTAGTSCGGTQTSGVQAGGGDQTIISGTGVTFKLDSGAGGFVSTNQVTSIQLFSPGLNGNTQITGGAPVLIDEENSNFIHLDASAPPSSGPSFTGLVYQAPSATGGGVEIGATATSATQAVLAGQVLAYSLNAFGPAAHGPSVDFSGGYGGIGLPAIANSGNNESSLVSSVDPLTSDGSGNDVFVMHYSDEWALDAYDSYIQIGSDSSNQVFFSQKMWYSASPAGTLPPEPNGGSGTGTYASDLKPAYPDVTAGASWTNGSGAGSYTKVSDPTTSTYSDYTESVPLGTSGNAKYEISGFWTWGHQSDLTTTPPWTKPSNYTAQVKVTFPAQPGTTVSITMGIYDGDHCGDFAIYQQTFTAPGQPGGGQPVAGSVTIEQ